MGWIVNRNDLGKVIGATLIDDITGEVMSVVINSHGWSKFLDANAKLQLDISDGQPVQPSAAQLRDRLLTPKATAALFLLLRDLQGGQPAPNWAKTLATNVLTAIDAAGNA